jgi:hypothetical protein
MAKYPSRVGGLACGARDGCWKQSPEMHTPPARSSTSRASGGLECMTWSLAPAMAGDSPWPVTAADGVRLSYLSSTGT